MQRENKKHKVDGVGFKLKGKVIFFATGNIHKFNEVRAVLSGYGIATGMLKIKGTEIQSDQIEEIASTSAANAFNECKLPVIVEDAGLFIDELNGFPGPYAAYVFKTIGNAGILKLLEKGANRKATFKSALAYCDSESGEILCFKGKVSGQIGLQEKTEDTTSAFGFDPIFIPDGSKKTFAQMHLAEKNLFSHRAMAINKFAQWYKSKL